MSSASGLARTAGRERAGAASDGRLALLRGREGVRDPVRRAEIVGLGAAVPRRAVANAEVAARLGVDAEWIATRTGVRERRIAAPGETLTELSVAAAAEAIERAALDPERLDVVLVATITADDLVPNAAPLVAARLGATRAAAIDVGAACTGFLSGLAVAAAQVEAGRGDSALVVGADLMSRITDRDDRSTAGLFGDGAGAVVVGAGGGGAIGPVVFGTDGEGAAHVAASHAERKLRMDGRPTFRAAVAHLSEVTLEAAARAGVALAEIDLFVYHQANQRILTAVGEQLGLPADRVVDCIARYGNTSAASVPIALAEAAADGRLRPGTRVFLGAFGAGFTWAGTLLRWGEPR
ncbi:MAG: beta-ketoacyl-ACP synthase 3 [Solirubrobacterales bacterium]